MLCRWSRCCVGGRGAVSVVEVLCRWSRCCVGGRGAARAVDALCGGRGAARAVEVLRGSRGVACKKNAKICSKKREITHGFVWRQFAKEQS